jgi:hypothetical protein
MDLGGVFKVSTFDTSCVASPALDEAQVLLGFQFQETLRSF